MRKISNVTSSAFSLVGALILTLSVPAFAFAEGSAGTAASGGANSSGAGASQSTVQTDKQQLVADKQQVAQDKAQLAADKTAQSQVNREKVCTAHKQGLETKFNAIVANSQRVETKIGSIYAKAQAYQTKNNLSVDSSLTDAVATAKSNADAAITNLQGVKPSLDCNSASVSTDVANFKTAAAQTRDALKAYRQAVINYIQALVKVASTDKTSGTSSTGGNQ